MFAVQYSVRFSTVAFRKIAVFLPISVLKTFLDSVKVLFKFKLI